MLVFFLFAGCSLVQSLLGDPTRMAADAEAKLRAGDFTGAQAAYDQGLARYPTNVDLASGSAYLKVLADNLEGADAALAGAEKDAGPRLSEVKLRRALVAIQKGDFDKAKTFAIDSGEPAGRLLAAEVELADGNRDLAKDQLEIAKGAGGIVGETAGQYLALIADPNVFVAGLSETQALWALGDRKIAVRSVGDLVKAYAETHDDGADQLLLWAGRAASVGEAAVANELLDAITVPPAGQSWRVAATRAIALCADGQGQPCSAGLDALSLTAPADGLSDARATAALAIAKQDPDTAKALLQGLTGDAPARVWVELGDPAAAAKVAKDPFFKATLGG